MNQYIAFSDSQPLVTVIIPSYNHELYIAQAIESVILQSYKNIELIVIDDGSKDQSLQIISTLADKYGFKVIARENRGLAKTLNEGIRLARGKYICFLASDDYYLPQRIENAVIQLESAAEKVAAVYCDGYIVNNEGKNIGLFGKKYSRPLAGSVYNNLLVGNWIPALGMTYKVEVLKEFMFDERFKVEDYTLYLRMFNDKKNDLIFYDAFDFAYRWHGNNFSQSTELMNHEAALLKEHFLDFGRYAQFKQLIKNRRVFDVEIVRWSNYFLLYLQLIRQLQNKSQSNHQSVVGLLLFYILRYKRNINERMRGVRYFGFTGLVKGIRVAGHIYIRGRKSNFRFGNNCKILGDVHLTLEDTWRGMPSITLGDNVTIDHNVCMNFHGGTITVGSNCHFGIGCVVQDGGKLIIGDGVLFGPGTKIFASNHAVKNISTTIAQAQETFAGISIGSNIWVGANCTIVDGAVLRDGSVYGAGGVIAGEYAAGSINVAKKVRITDVI